MWANGKVGKIRRAFGLMILLFSKIRLNTGVLEDPVAEVPTLPLAAILVLLLFSTFSLVNQVIQERDYNPISVPKPVPVSSNDSAVLSKYDLVILLDRSASMADFDCKEARGIMTNRWNWAAKQLATFSWQTAACLPRGFTVITFGSQVMRYDNCHAAELTSIYRSQKPNGGTDLAGAFEMASTNRTQTDKPLAIVVVTDGVPDDERRLSKDIVNACNANSKQDMRVVFLTVGSGNSSDFYLHNLNKRLLKFGAKFDAVRTVPFANLEKIGISRAIASSLEIKQP